MRRCACSASTATLAQASRRSRLQPDSHPEPAASTTTSQARKQSSPPASSASSQGSARSVRFRHVLGSLGDLKAELTLTARYVLAELDSESELLRILASDARNRPQLLTAADQLVSSTFTGFAAWIGGRAERAISAEEAKAIAAFGLGSLLSSRLLRDVLGIPAQVDDETLVDTWVQMMVTALADPTHA